MAVNIRPASAADLDALNRVVEAAVLTWQLPERVKRLALPSYRYTTVDLQHLTTDVAVDHTGTVVGVATWEPAAPKDTPTGQCGLLLHGLYVAPDMQRHGIGRQLFRAALGAARAVGADGLLVKAQNDAVGFFLAQGMTLLPVEDPERHHTNRLWLMTDQPAHR